MAGYSKLADVEGWIKRQQQLDGPVTGFVRVAVPPGWKPGDSIATDPLRFGASTDKIFNAVPGGEIVQPVAVATDGVLGRLRAISLQLAESSRGSRRKRRRSC